MVKPSESPSKLSPARIIGIVLAILGIFAFQQFASKVGAIIADPIDYGVIDPDRAFMANGVHHVIQALIALVPILILAKLFGIDFGFRKGEVRLGMKIVGIMSAVLFVYTILSYIIGYAFDLIRPYGYPLNARNIAGTMAFQLFFTGPSEEILFRALPIAFLAYVMRSRSKTASAINVLIVALLFSIAHIRWSFGPTGLSFRYDVIQLIFAFALGTVQGFVFLKTKSVYYSMAIHSISNVLAVGGGYLIVLLVA
ncbi:MAG: CPBP family intramembrane metalloprotease [Clostridiaceae bacterium]|nr:CPBP family intramembrane metalloprotease [Clostridiaceae bacterium]